MATHVSLYSKFANYHPPVVKKIYESYVKRMNFPKTGTFSAMDIGCGDGKLLFEALIPSIPSNCNEIIATDVDEAMISHCRSIYTIENVKFLINDIGNEKLPSELFENRFSAIFSSFCFMYVKNIRQGLLNCKRLLKSNRDILLVLTTAKNPLQDVHAQMVKMDAWKPYIMNSVDFIPHFSSNDPDSEAISLFEDVGLELVEKEFRPNQVFESNRRNFIGVFRSMDSVYRRIPVEKQLSYKKDFDQILSDITGVDFVDPEILDEALNLKMPIGILHGRKLKK